MKTNTKVSINIKLLSGKIIKLNVNEIDTVMYIKNQIQEMEGVDINQQQIILNGLLLSLDTKICDIKIAPNSIFTIIHKLRE